MTEAIEILRKQRDWCKSRGKTLEAHHINKMIERLQKAIRDNKCETMQSPTM